MKGRWKPYCQDICGERMYIAGRKLDEGRPLHGGNVEYRGEYSRDRALVQEACDGLNGAGEEGASE